MVVVVLMMRFVEDIFVSASSLESKGSVKVTEVCRSVGEGGSDSVVGGGVAIVDIFWFADSGLAADEGSDIQSRWFIRSECQWRKCIQ